MSASPREPYSRPRLLAGATLLLFAAACMGMTSGSTTSTAAGQTTTTLSAPDATTSTTLGPAIPVVLEPTAGVERNEPSPDAPVAELVEGLNNAGFDLWRIQPVEPNLVFSPSSIGHALLMARAAADDATGEAIDAAFGLPDGLGAHQAWNAVYHFVIESAERAEPLFADDGEDEGAPAPDEDVIVVMADRIWPDSSASPDQEWVDLLAAEHGASVEVLELQRNPEGSADAINDWINEQTRGLIPELATPEDTALAVLILTDTIYFKASWLFAFSETRTRSDTFTRLDGTTLDVDFMAHERFGPDAAQGDGWVAAEIPYVGEEFSMLVIVPDEGRFADLRDSLDQDMIDEIDDALYSGNHALFLPKWDNEFEMDLEGWLTSIGAVPGFYPGIGAPIGSAKHAAKIIVDELGTEAAAATMLAFTTSFPPPTDIEVRADRPFLYLIRHNPTGLVLFAGQVTDPSQTSGS